MDGTAGLDLTRLRSTDFLTNGSFCATVLTFLDIKFDESLFAFERETNFESPARRTVNPSIVFPSSVIYYTIIPYMPEKLTKKQKQIVDFISTFLRENSYSPSYREIMIGVGLSSVSAVAEHIENLVAKGVLRKIPGAARSLEVTIDIYPETVTLFAKAINSSESEEDIQTLLRAAAILGLDPDSIQRQS